MCHMSTIHDIRVMVTYNIPLPISAGVATFPLNHLSSGVADYIFPGVAPIKYVLFVLKKLTYGDK